MPLKRLLIGRPLETSALASERLKNWQALAVFSADPLSSVAYATEEILLVLVMLGTVAVRCLLPVSALIIALLFMVVLSYRQAILAYPSGGGGYVVSLHELGLWAGLVAGAALLIDYVLTVAVSVSAGVAAITSAWPYLHGHRVLLGVGAIVFITIMNLRGVRESGVFFAIPTYFFVFTLGALICLGTYRVITGGAHWASLPCVPPLASLTPFLWLRAFAAGCTALTGVETISNGVQAFYPPETANARKTMLWMGGLLAFLFGGISFLTRAFGIVPSPGETVVSQLAATVVSRGLLYYLVQVSTALILFLAANSAFNGFPRLAAVMARDGFFPRFMSFLGDRLVYSHGIFFLGALAAGLIIGFHARTHALIPLYAVGVFTTFTLCQYGVLRHWLRERGPGWWWNAIITGLGGTATLAATIVIVSAKFLEGAWIVILLIAGMVWVSYSVQRHYHATAEELRLQEPLTYPTVGDPLIIVPVAGVHRGVIKTLAYAQALSKRVMAVHVAADPEVARKVETRWQKYIPDLPLTVLPSPYRSVYQPLLDFIDAAQAQATAAHTFVVVLLPEFVPRRWWHYFLHNQTGLKLQTLLLLRKDVLVAGVPFHLPR